jgi:hypothetical protein
MSSRLASTCVLAAVVAGVLLAGCGYVRNPQLGPKPTSRPNAGPVVPPSGETPEQAALRLFAPIYRHELRHADKPERLRGAAPGAPVPVVRDYRNGPNVAWVLPDDRHSASGNLFAAMWPVAMRKDGFIVPMVKNGRSIDEMYVYLDGGAWTAGSPDSGWAYDDLVDGKYVQHLPRGDVATLESATTRLKSLLGEATVVRTAVFVPSGNAFAVGDNGGREAAVLLGWVMLGPGIDTHHGPSLASSQFGQLFTHDQLAALYHAAT